MTRLQITRLSAPAADTAAPATPTRLVDTIEPLLSVGDLARALNASRRTIERLKAAGKLPKPDLHLGRMPRWRPDTIRTWIDSR